MRANRLLSILMELQVKGRVTAQALSAQFEVSRRTIYRDVEELSASGIPVYAEKGPGGGFRLVDGYRTRLTGLSQPEVEALLLVGLAGPAADLGLGAQAASARLKLLAALPPQATDAALRVGDRFHLDPVEWYRRKAQPAALADVSRAVWEGRRLTIDYESWKGRHVRDVSPYGLVMKGGTWYLIAASRRRPAIHRVDQIRAAIVLEEAVVRPRDFDLATYWQAEVARFEASLRRAKATIRVDEDALRRIDQLGADIAESVRATSPDGTGRRTTEIDIESVGHAAGVLLGFADGIEVLKPMALRHELATRAARVIRLYRART